MTTAGWSGNCGRSRSRSSIRSRVTIAIGDAVTVVGESDHSAVGRASLDGELPPVGEERAETVRRVVEPSPACLGNRWSTHAVTITPIAYDFYLSATDRSLF